MVDRWLEWTAATLEEIEEMSRQERVGERSLGDFRHRRERKRGLMLHSDVVKPELLAMKLMLKQHTYPAVRGVACTLTLGKLQQPSWA